MPSSSNNTVLLANMMGFIQILWISRGFHDYPRCSALLAMKSMSNLVFEAHHCAGADQIVCAEWNGLMMAKPSKLSI